MTGYHEERLAELRAALPTPPREWVHAAQELPRFRAEADRLAVEGEHGGGIILLPVDRLRCPVDRLR